MLIPVDGLTGADVFGVGAAVALGVRGVELFAPK